MAATLGVVGYNTIIRYESGPGTYTAITEPKDISGPEITCEFADFTHMQSPLGFRERKPTIKSSGNVTFKCNFVHDDTSHEYLTAAATANPPTLETFQIEYPNGQGWDFDAYVSLSWTSPMAGPLEMNVTLSIDGQVTPIEAFTT
jgi:hypothetical protein